MRKFNPVKTIQPEDFPKVALAKLLIFTGDAQVTGQDDPVSCPALFP